MATSARAIAPEHPPSWPLTSAARSRLIDEISRIRRDLSELTGQGLEEGIVRLPVSVGIRRLDSLNVILERARVVDDVPCAAIGRRATIREESGESVAYEIVLPGGGDPTEGCISADSPLGRAILGAQVGDVVEVRAPAGNRLVTLISVS